MAEEVKFVSLEIAAADQGHRLGPWLAIETPAGAFGVFEAACVAPRCHLKVRAKFGSRLPRGVQFDSCPVERRGPSILPV